MFLKGIWTISALINVFGGAETAHHVQVEDETPIENWHAMSDYGNHNVLNEIPDVVIVVGDIHGDLWAFERLMMKAGIVDHESHWINYPDRTQYLIQLGDVVDRGPRSGAAVDFSEQMFRESRENGDLAFYLIGNHELFLMCGQFAYFSHDELRYEYDSSIMRAKLDYSSNGSRGKIIRTYLPALRMNDTYFIHAGVDDNFRNLTVTEMQHLFTESVDINGCSATGDPLDIIGSNGPFWTRKVSGKFNTNTPWQYHEKTCQYVEQATAEIGAEKVVVGHTVTETQNVEPWCGGKWTMHDTGLSRWMMSSPRFSVMYKTTDNNGKVLPLSQWVHVMWEDTPTGLATNSPLKGTFLNTGNLPSHEREKFMKDTQKYQGETSGDVSSTDKKKKSREEL